MCHFLRHAERMYYISMRGSELAVSNGQSCVVTLYQESAPRRCVARTTTEFRIDVSVCHAIFHSSAISRRTTIRTNCSRCPAPNC